MSLQPGIDADRTLVSQRDMLYGIKTEDIRARRTDIKPNPPHPSK